MNGGERASGAVVVAVGVQSAAALAYEILLIRLFAIVEWHHLSFLVISLALLGYGMSGTVLALVRERALKNFSPLSALCAAAFGITSVGSLVIAQRIELNSLEIIWNPRELQKLFFFYLLFALPFGCAATAIGLTLTRFGEQSPRVYRADLLGAGCSAAAITALLFFVHPVTALQIVAAAGFFAGALFLIDRRLLATSVIAAGILLVASFRPLLLPIRISQFKELSQALRVPAARVIDERSSPLGLLTVVDSPVIPFRFAPGLSLGYTGELPPQLGVFSDGSGMTVITRNGHFDYMPSAAAYHLRPLGSVAVLGAGGGGEVLSALAHGASRVTAVEMNPQMIEIVRDRFGRYAGDIYGDPHVRLVQAEGRGFIRSSGERFDMIDIALVDSFAASTAGVQALSESYLYTREALREMLGHLSDGGYLLITRWTRVPPRDLLKLLATAAVALEDMHLRPADSIAIVRTWNTATVIVKRGEISRSEVDALRTFCDERSFDLDYAPGVRRGETNRYNILDEPRLFDLTAALVAGGNSREQLFERYKFFIRPAVDDRPYFFHFFRWRALPELLRLRGRSGMPLVEWGYVILIAAIVQALIAAVLFVLLPLVFLRRRIRTSAVRLTGYFGSIGLGFLFIEIAFIQKLNLVLGNPLYAVAVVLSSFLLFAGIGSGIAGRLHARGARLVPALVAVAALLDLPILQIVASHGLGFPAPLKVAISAAVIAPLAFLMGMPFPAGVKRLAADDRAAVPWAWGVNGTASVLSSMLATLVAVHFGFTIVVVSAALLYVLAAWWWPS